MSEFKTALYINTANRYVQAFVSSVTQTKPGQLVLRKSILMGELSHLVGDYGFGPNMPIIISLRGYKALSSAGFVKIHLGSPYVGTPTYSHAQIVGMLGFPWQKHKGLSILRTPEKVVIFHPQGFVKRLKTHDNPNVATSEAALQGVELLSRLNWNLAYITKGQSNGTDAFEISMSRSDVDKMKGRFEPNWPAEHSPKFAPAPAATPPAVVNASPEEDFSEDDSEGPYLGKSTLAKLRDIEFEE